MAGKWSSLATVFLAPALGALAGGWVYFQWIMPAVGLGGLNRIVAIGNYLEAPYTQPQVAVALGSSVVREAINGAEAARVSEGWVVQNMGMGACSMTERQVILEKLLRAGPGAVIFPMNCWEMGRLGEIPWDKAHAYALGRFVQPDDPDAGSWWLGIDDTQMRVLAAPPWRARLSLRVAPHAAANRELRTRLRSTIIRVAPDEWSDPHEYELTIKGWRLERHVNEWLHNITQQLQEDQRDGIRCLERMAERTRDAGAVPVLIRMPIHPLMADSLESYMSELRGEMIRIAEAYDGLWIDAHDLWDSACFTDAVHANAEGRRRLSRLIGENLLRVSVEP